jgi:16S rRNA processing protein RimM
LNKNDFIKIGKITSNHGIKGYARFNYFGDLENFDYKEVFLEKGGKLLSYFIENFKYYKNYILLKLKGIESINDVETFLKGREVFIHRSQLQKLEKDEFYWFELIGLKVYNINGKYLGIIDNIIETGSNDVFVVKQDKQEKLIPYIEDIVKEINIQKRKMIVEELEEI